MKIPKTLKHKPVIAAENYDNIDGRYAYNSDAKGISLGLAQWNDRGKVDISAKVWRFTGNKWSRQSEELPLHRILDLAILFCKTKHYFSNEAYRHEKSYDENKTVLDKIALQGDAMNIEICTDNPKIDEDIKLFQQEMNNDDELISERLVRLAAILQELGYFSIEKNHENKSI